MAAACSSKPANNFCAENPPWISLDNASFCAMRDARLSKDLCMELKACEL